MGLAISVGNPFLGDDEGEQAYRRRMEGLRDALAGRGVEWSEPDTVAPPSAMRKHISSFPYRYLHYLRRAYALFYLGIPVMPAASYEDVQAADHQIEDATLGLSSHLLCHADTAGYYVPVDFDDPLFLDQAIDGDGMVGSSFALLDELRRVAPLIDVELTDQGELSDAEAARLFGSDVDADNPYGIEQTVWLTLHEACQASIDHGNAVVFH
jgi:hypothetical protein